MRVTNQMMTNSMLLNLNAQRARSLDLQEQIATGKRIKKVSEDPGAGAELMRLQHRAQVKEQWAANAENAQAWVGDSDNALNDLTQLLSAAKELALRGANSTMNAENRKAIAAQLDQIGQDIVTTLNQKGGAVGSIFAGTMSDIVPFTFDQVTGLLTYAGDTGSLQREVGPGVQLTVNVDGTRFGDPSNNPVKTLWDMAQLLNGGAIVDQPSISALNQHFDMALALRSEVGATQRRLDQAGTALEDLGLSLEKAIEGAQGVQLEHAMIELTSAETTYRAALQVGARIIPPTLVDFLR